MTNRAARAGGRALQCGHNRSGRGPCPPAVRCRCASHGSRRGDILFAHGGSNRQPPDGSNGVDPGRHLFEAINGLCDHGLSSGQMAVHHSVVQSAPRVFRSPRLPTCSGKRSTGTTFGRGRIRFVATPTHNQSCRRVSRLDRLQPTTRLIAVLVTVTSGALSACTPRTEAGSAISRNILTTVWDTVWSVSGQPEHPILEPGALASDTTHVYVVDWSERRLVALRAADGTQAWSAGRLGLGPGEFQQPVFVSSTSTGDVAVVDQATRRLTRYATDGSKKSDLSLLPLGGAPESFCALPGGGFLFALFASDSLVELLPTGERGRSVLKPSPVRDPKGLLDQVVLAGDASAAVCAAVLYLGVGYSMVSLSDSSRAFPFVEPVELPRWLRSAAGEDSLSSERLAALDAVVRNDTLWVLFQGNTDSQKRLLDAYDVRTGAYLSTLLLPTRANQFALAGDVIVLEAGQNDGSFALIAIRAAR